jgi:hypothetical protein
MKKLFFQILFRVPIPGMHSNSRCTSTWGSFHHINYISSLFNIQKTTMRTYNQFGKIVSMKERFVS